MGNTPIIDSNYFHLAESIQWHEMVWERYAGMVTQRALNLLVKKLGFDHSGQRFPKCSYTVW